MYGLELAFFIWLSHRKNLIGKSECVLRQIPHNTIHFIIAEKNNLFKILFSQHIFGRFNYSLRL